MFERPIFNPDGLYIKEDLIPTLSKLSLDWPPTEDARINFPLSANEEFEMEVEMSADKISCLDLARNCDLSYSVALSEPYQEQIRRHKKKRINKKWAKRYGFRTKYKKMRFSEVSIVPKGCGYEFTTNRTPIFVKGE